MSTCTPLLVLLTLRVSVPHPPLGIQVSEPNEGVTRAIDDRLRDPTPIFAGAGVSISWVDSAVMLIRLDEASGVLPATPLTEYFRFIYIHT